MLITYNFTTSMHNRRMGKQSKSVANSTKPVVAKPAAKPAREPPAGTRAALIAASARLRNPFPDFAPSTGGSEASDSTTGTTAKEVKNQRRLDSIAMRDQLAHRRSGGMVAALAAETDVGSGAQMEVVVEEAEDAEEAEEDIGEAERLSALEKKAEALCRIQCWCRLGILRRKWADKKLVRLMALRILCWMRRMRRARVAVSIRRDWVVLSKPVSPSMPEPVPPSGSSSSRAMEVGDEDVEVATQPQPVVAGRVYELKGVDESYHPFVAGAKKAFNLTKKTKTAKTFVPPTQDVKWDINETGFAACVRCLNERPGCLFGEVVVNGRNGKEILNHRKGGTCAAKLP
ncbi:hypothetical protein B484DRAFT_403563, partial [Ochromonadaceae sp. CCMP2298]